MKPVRGQVQCVSALQNHLVYHDIFKLRELDQIWVAPVNCAVPPAGVLLCKLVMFCKFKVNTLNRIERC